MKAAPGLPLFFACFAVIAIPMTATAAGDPVNGKALYNAHCASCHGSPRPDSFALMGANNVKKLQNQIATEPMMMTPDLQALTTGQLSDIAAFLGTFVAPPPAALNYGGLWWAAPAASEDGWGINFAQQGTVIFGTWFTYDTTGKGWWLTLITNGNPSAGVYTADLFALTSGSPFNATPFHGGSISHVGTATLTFSDVSNGTFHYDVNLPGGTVSQTKTITQQQFGALAICSTGKTSADLAAATNYQDIWWAGTSAAPGTEQGWGINFTHQGDLVFASWFTFDLDGNPLWLVATAAKIAPGVYKGDLYRPSGPRFDAYDKGQWHANASVGTMTLTFADGNNATFDYTVMIPPLPGPVTQRKIITRQIFASPTTCT